MTFTAIDLFSGAGGLSAGLQSAGFRVLFASDIDEKKITTFQANHQETRAVAGDISELSASDIAAQVGLKAGELDLLAGGPPCQGFSINAPVRTMDDGRNHLFLEFTRIARTLLPKCILIENVPGIVSMDRGGVVAAIYRELESMGYDVSHRILFAGHYGVPQTRWRTIFIGVREGLGVPTFPEPVYNAQAVANFAGGRELCFRLDDEGRFLGRKLARFTSVADAIFDLPVIPDGGGSDEMPYLFPPKTEYQKLLRGSSSTLYNHRAGGLSQINHQRLQYIPPGGSWRDIPFELLPEGMRRARRSDHTKRYGRLHPDQLCSTILTKCDPHWGAFFHPTQDRVLSVREAARIQSFPDSFRFFGSLMEQYEQVGNAVPPLLAQAIGVHIIRTILTQEGQAVGAEVRQRRIPV